MNTTTYVHFEKKNIYLIIWILFLAGAVKSLSQVKWIGISYLPLGKWDKLDINIAIHSSLV